MKDYIDFPCSDTFLRAYHEQGLTPRHPDYYREIQDLQHKVRGLELSVEQLTQRLDTLIARLIQYEQSRINLHPLSQTHNPIRDKPKGIPL